MSAPKRPRGRASKATPADATAREPRAADAKPVTLLMVRDPDEGWTMQLEARSRAVALEAQGADVVHELEDLSLSLVRLEGFDGPRQVERLEDLAARGVRFALVRAERRRGDRVVWLRFELCHEPAQAA